MLVGRGNAAVISRSTSVRRSWPIVAVLVTMTALQLTVAAFSVYVLSAVRAYVAGESLYSKGQKDAQIYLLAYAEDRLESDYQKLLSALAVPIADRRAREELQKPRPDWGLARQAFIDGGNHPDDVQSLIFLFRWFGDTPLMAPAVTSWTEGDRLIERMRRLAEQTHARIQSGMDDEAALRQIRSEAPLINRQLTQLESEFSHQLGQASRQAQRLLLALNAILAAVLTLAGFAFVRRTARTQAASDTELAQRQESLQNLLDSTAEGLFGVDLDGRCTFVNRAALRMLGYDHERELLGSAILDLIEGPTDGHDAKVLQQPEYDNRAGYSDRDEFRRRDGNCFPVERWTYPLMRDGRAQGIVTTFFDISERVKLRSELRREQVAMERLVGSVTDGVMTYRDDMRVVVFNAAAERLFLVTAADALGSRVDRFLRGDLPTPEQVRTDLPGRLYELTGVRADDTTFHLEASFSRVETDEGVLNTAVLRDVTARELARAERQAREALEATSRAKTDFLSRMSHELRTPLNAVIGFAHLLRVDPSRPPSEQQLERILHIEKAGSHLLALVNDVLDLSRIEADEMAVANQAVDLGAAVEEAVTMVSPLVTKAGVELVVLSEPEAAGLQRRLFHRAVPAHGPLVWVSADPVRLRQVLVNLLSNAIKYNRPHGSVFVSWTADRTQCELSVADTGHGMPADKIAQLFQPFNRLGAESSRVEGTGIGLALSRRLTEMMGGRLHITSVEGKGTTATVVLGIAAPRLVAADEASPPPQSRATGRRLDVLYAEDNEVNAELVRQVLRMRPEVTLRVAESGRAALDMARSDPPDLALVDMNLGDMTGLELARELWRTPATRDVELVALSADALPEQIETALKSGFRDYLTKPVDFRKLLQLLDERLGG
jgi:PAS domain S-box-containing protein